MMRTRSIRLLSAAALLSYAWSATTNAAWAGEDAPQQPSAPAVYAALAECRKLTGDAERLACFDARSAELDAAFAKSEVVIADRAQVREAKRGLFGLSLPDLKLFSRDEDDVIEQIESTITRVSRTQNDKLMIWLEDGAVWTQVDTRSAYPKVGEKVVIRQAAMGSYLANIEGRVAIRMRRLVN